MTDVQSTDFHKPLVPVTADVKHRAALTVAWRVRDKQAARELLDMLGLTDKETP